MQTQILASLLATLVGCSDPSGGRETEVRLQVTVAESLDAQILRVRVFDTERALASERIQMLEGVEAPIVVPLFPEGEGARSYHVVMDLLGPGGSSLGTQRVIAGYLPGQRRVVRVHFSPPCSETVCSGRETCREVGGAAECVHACFDTQDPSEDSLPDSQTCPARVYVDGVSGVNDPMACYGPEAPCADAGFVIDGYLGDGAGGIVEVAGVSTYAGFGIGADSSGTAESPTTIRAWPGTGRPVFRGDGERPVIGVCCSESSANNFVLEGLEVVNGGGQGIQVHGSGVSNATIRNCVVRETVLSGTVEFPVQEGGIVVTNEASGVHLIGNVVRDNTGTGIFDREPVGTNGIAIVGRGMTLEDNVVMNNSGDGIVMIGDNHLAVRNRVIDSGGAGWFLNSADNNTLEDNVVCGSAAEGLALFRSTRSRIEHNTFLRSGEDGVALGGYSNDATIVGNAIAFSGGFGLSRVLEEESEPTDSDNLYWMNASGAMQGTVPDGSDWLDTVDPLFANIQECDAALGSASEAARLIDGGPVGARPASD